MFLYTTGTVVGWEAADLIHRKLVCIPAGGSLPSGYSGTIDQYNAAVVSARPSGASIGWQFGLAAAGFLTGILVPWGWLKCLLYGIGTGSVAHVGCQLLNFYVVEPLFVSTTAKDSSLFQDAYVANQMMGYTTTTTTTATGTTSGPVTSAAGTPVVVRQLPASQPVRVPSVLARSGQLGQTDKAAVPASNLAPACGCPDRQLIDQTPPAAPAIPKPPALPQVTPSSAANAVHPLFAELLRASSVRVAA